MKIDLTSKLQLKRKKRKVAGITAFGREKTIEEC